MYARYHFLFFLSSSSIFNATVHLLSLVLSVCIVYLSSYRHKYKIYMYISFSTYMLILLFVFLYRFYTIYLSFFSFVQSNMFSLFACNNLYKLNPLPYVTTSSPIPSWTQIDTACGVCVCVCVCVPLQNGRKNNSTKEWTHPSVSKLTHILKLSTNRETERKREKERPSKCIRNIIID